MVSSKPVIISGGAYFPFNPFPCFLEEDGTRQDFASSVSHMLPKRKLKQDELQGRVNSAYRLLALSTPPLGYFLAGFLLQVAGTRPTILFFLICLLLLALLANWRGCYEKLGRPGSLLEYMVCFLHDKATFL